jgi:hypothetical protein
LTVNRLKPVDPLNAIVPLMEVSRDISDAFEPTMPQAAAAL